MIPDPLKQAIEAANLEMAEGNADSDLMNAVEISEYLGPSAQVVVGKVTPERPTQAQPNPGALPVYLATKQRK